MNSKKYKNAIKSILKDDETEVIVNWIFIGDRKRRNNQFKYFQRDARKDGMTLKRI